MYFLAKMAVEFFCGFHVCHMEAMEFFGKHADKRVGAEEADRFFFYPIFICIGIAFFNGIQPVSFFCVVYSADSVEKKKEILYFLRFFPAAVVPAFPVEKRNFPPVLHRISRGAGRPWMTPALWSAARDAPMR